VLLVFGDGQRRTVFRLLSFGTPQCPFPWAIFEKFNTSRFVANPYGFSLFYAICLPYIWELEFLGGVFFPVFLWAFPPTVFSFFCYVVFPLEFLFFPDLSKLAWGSVGDSSSFFFPTFRFIVFFHHLLFSLKVQTLPSLFPPRSRVLFTTLGSLVGPRGGFLFN